MIKRVLYCEDTDQYFKCIRGWLPPDIEYVKQVKKAARYGFSKNEDDAVALIISAGRDLGLTFTIKQVKVIPASIELVE